MDGGDMKSHFFIDVLLYWLAFLPILLAIIVWLYFLVNKRLVNKVKEEWLASGNSDDTTEGDTSPPKSVYYIDPPSYSSTLELGRMQPQLHHSYTTRNSEYFNSSSIVSALEDLPPPSYHEAIAIPAILVSKASESSGACSCSSSSSSSSSSGR